MRNNEIRKINRRQLLHLIKALSFAGYYKSFKEKEAPKLDFKFIQAVGRLLLASKSKKVQTVLNSFKVIRPNCFEGVKRVDCMTEDFKKGIRLFLMINLLPQEFEEAEKYLFQKRKKKGQSRQFCLYDSVPKADANLFFISDYHPQKIIREEARV